MPSPIADGVVFSGMMSKVAVAPFLKKMHEMVEDPVTDQVVSWSESGESFVVWRQLEFSRDLLPQSFKHNNFSSFVRQLSNYGFRKVTPERWEFTNVHFRPGMQRLLSDIKRRRCSPLSFTLKSPPPSPRSSKEEEEGQSYPSNTSTSPRHHNHHHRDLELLVENTRLKKQNQFLVSDVERAKERYERLLRLLSNYVDVSDCETLVEMKRKQITEYEVAVAEGGGGNSKKKKKQIAIKLFGVTIGPARKSPMKHEQQL